MVPRWNPIINRRSSLVIIRMLDIMYKCGVLDAYDVEDDNYCAAFVKDHKENFTFGMLDIEGDISWREWRYSIDLICRRTHMYVLAEQYLDRLYTKNYLWAILPIAFDFYCMGIEDWCKYPNPTPIELFKTQRMMPWGKPTRGDRLPKRTTDDMVSLIQKVCFDHSRDKVEDGESYVCAGAYDSFASSIWVMTRKLPPAVIHVKAKR